MYKKYIKRLLDILLSLIAIVILFPLFLIVGVLVLLFLGQPAIFRQKRPGKNEKIFKLYKFRTMNKKCDKDGNLLPDKDRLTMFGKFLRKTSLDEIPEFLNILKGDMSLIGPRPLLVEYLDYYTEEERHRHDVRPGLTGLAQVNGRNLLSWDDKFKKDLEYVNNISFLVDVKILFNTIIAVLKSNGINTKKGTTMEYLSVERKKRKMSYNVLMLSVGRRVELVKRFKRAAKELNIDSKIVGVDIDDLAPALYFCDERVIVPRIDDDAYISSLIDVCKKYDIKLIIPTIDTELIKLAENSKLFEDNNIMINLSSLDVVTICRNKKNTQKWLEDNGINAPKMINEKDLKKKNYSFPLFIKPLDGSSSINAFNVNNQKELDFFKEFVPNPIIQEKVVGKEYTIDAFCDFDSNPITIVPRERIAVRSGEISKGYIIKDRVIIDEVKNLLLKLKPVGHITIQCIKTNDNKVNILEINPRFGGGAPMSIDVGADSPKNLYRILMGENLEYNEDYKDNLYFSRFDDAIMINLDEKNDSI